MKSLIAFKNMFEPTGVFQNLGMESIEMLMIKLLRHEVGVRKSNHMSRLTDNVGGLIQSSVSE
jgi:hypothetical protein